MIKKIWGTTYDEVIDDGRVIWRIWIKKPFQKMNSSGWWIGLNEKMIRTAQSRGVSTFIIDYDPAYAQFWLDTGLVRNGIHMSPPSKKEIEEMDKNPGDFQDIPSKFPGASPMRIYYFVA